MLGIDLIKGQLDRLTGASDDDSGAASSSSTGNPKAAASALDTSDVDAEVKHLLAAGGLAPSASASSRSSASHYLSAEARDDGVVPGRGSVAALLASGGGTAFEMPITGADFLEAIARRAGTSSSSASVAGADGNDRIYDDESEGAAIDEEIPDDDQQIIYSAAATSISSSRASSGLLSPEAIAARKTARLAVALDAMTRFTAFSAVGPDGSLSAGGAADGARSVGLARRHLFLDDAAVPPIVDTNVSITKPPAIDNKKTIRVSLPGMVASTIANYASTDAPVPFAPRKHRGNAASASSAETSANDSVAEEAEKARETTSAEEGWDIPAEMPPSAEEEEEAMAAAAAAAKAALVRTPHPYSGIEVYEVTGTVNMALVRDFALALGRRGLLGSRPLPPPPTSEQ